MDFLDFPAKKASLDAMAKQDQPDLLDLRDDEDYLACLEFPVPRDTEAFPALMAQREKWAVQE